MYCLLTDETNAEASAKAKFFIYGGLFFHLDKLPDLDRRIQAIRTKAGYKLGDSFKFDTNFRPKHVSIEASTEAKKDVVRSCLEIGCRFIALVILHKIIDKSKPENKHLWAADHVIGRFNRFLVEEGNDTGMVLIDTLPLRQQWQYLSDKFTNGLHLQGGNSVSLDRIRLYGSTCLNASYVASAIDIVLGSFRYCVNDPSNRSSAAEMIQSVAGLMWHVRSGDRILLRDRGLIFRPEVVKVDAYRMEYDKLYEHLKALIREA